MIRLFFITLLFLLLPFSAMAAFPASLQKDLAPLEGYVVMPIGDQEFLIDLDAADGVRTGDIFSIIHKGKPIIHPVSGEVIGSLDDSAAFLQVTRIKSGYSYARRIGGEAEITKGDKIKRFEGVPARFTDLTGQAQNLKVELQQQLTALDWLSETSNVEPLITFERTADRLLVKGQDGRVVLNYPMPVLTATTPQKPAPSAPSAKVPLKPAVIATTAAKSAPEGIIRKRQSSDRVWHGLEQNEEVVGLTIADFDLDGLQEVALLLQQSLVISRYQGEQQQQVAKLPISKRLTPLAVDSFDLNGNGRPELFVSAIKEGKPASCVYELEGQTLKEVACDLTMLFRRIESPQAGSILLGQKRLDLKVPFSGRPFEVTFVQGSYEPGTEYPLPLPANLYGFAPFSTPDGDPHYVFLNSSDYLTVMKGNGERLYESPDRFGGSENRFELTPDSPSDIPQVYFVPQRVLVINGEILATQNDGQRLTQRWRKYDKSRLVSLSWNGLSLDENWRTSDQNGQAADFAVTDIDNDGQKELVLAVKFARKGFLSKAKSALVVYETD